MESPTPYVPQHLPPAGVQRIYELALAQAEEQVLQAWVNYTLQPWNAALAAGYTQATAQLAALQADRDRALAPPTPDQV
jgi:hypothetical protein